MGAKSIGEIGINAPIPKIANAITDAAGVRLTKTHSPPSGCCPQCGLRSRKEAITNYASCVTHGA